MEERLHLPLCTPGLLSSGHKGVEGSLSWLQLHLGGLMAGSGGYEEGYEGDEELSGRCMEGTGWDGMAWDGKRRKGIGEKGRKEEKRVEK